MQKMNKLKFVFKEIKKGRLNYILFSIFTYPLSKTRLKDWRLKKKDEILVRKLTKGIKKSYNLNFLNIYSKLYCEALREVYEDKIYDFFESKGYVTDTQLEVLNKIYDENNVHNFIINYRS